MPAISWRGVGFKIDATSGPPEKRDLAGDLPGHE
jgi:hypothetical protein